MQQLVCRGLKMFTKECRPVKLFAKHLKVEQQVCIYSEVKIGVVYFNCSNLIYLCIDQNRS
jgi:hypothetical protein